MTDVLTAPPESEDRLPTLAHGAIIVRLGRFLDEHVTATGGTAAATAALVERLGGRIVGMSFLIELSELRGGAALSGHPYSALLRL